ncbi:N-terminal domain of NEFA-interacting nuclear protein NIP30-domain-containing protein [Fimicolochytrium jonesii]|uniref:N-terminal domain of NEFA-interacting nuclear protein NIP30-domain-containing protein n=1 Tax=Fimicolochytrium jonesii TaxID=1396493 RepID=UPI0022FEBC7E|nr:N-terminal domain of NEFA-interacting nuclear protein NIP30-domain-containing protein [Fimicolochytrium jonesii]KAI8820751.1 N-terminal domain of NEFA-interacting nuclear protein NIP30-domain-containing protein [Fimicolochytrium jonesii]
MGDFSTKNEAAGAMMGKFVSASEIESARNEREQEAKAEGREVDDIPYDPRPLYERLAEKKRIEEEEFAEKMKFGNLVRRLDEDEYQFLSNYSDETAKKDHEIAQETRRELDAFRKAVAEAQPPMDVKAAAARTTAADPTQKKPPAAQDFQRNLLKGVMVRKRKSEDLVVPLGKKARTDGDASKSPKAATAATKITRVPDTKPAPAAPANPLGLFSSYASDDDSDSS